ncbi:hypothetical protein KUTeg_009382 [Tegillarca granosa]|uniref:PHD finger protein 12 n=1 Tax=Tegillarca granosa TaxID=220873 RepID=A0ABQ9F3N5_TEGGR|nr:hypothetical protein KUTeg_009382 [Tegillarca granosa]
MIIINFKHSFNMTTVEYDLDTSGGLMEEIQKLISPPVNEETLRRQRRQEREYRRPGRAVNHDCCDSCKEGGDLLCCDRCPAAFHLQCHDPPLDEDDVPPGEWICHRCKVAPQKDDDASSTKSGSSTQSKGGKSRSNQPTPPIVLPTDMEVDGEECTNPLQMLAKAAKIMNPVQFSLPKDIACTTSLPGSSKRKWWGRDKTAQKKVAHELDNGMVPLPAKTCFTCSRSCRVGALLQCDFCPLLYHLDCLTPPLTSVPTGRWMCPNHPEHMIDEKLLQSESLTERVKLWDMYGGNLNQHNIKVSFLNKIHRQYPPFRLKVKHPPRKCAVIPSAIKEFYKNPPALLPRSFQSVSEDSKTSSGEQEQAAETTLEEQEERQIQKSDSNTRTSESSSVKLEKPTASVHPVIHGDFQPSNQTDSLSESSVKSVPTTSSDNKLCSTDDEKSVLNGPYFPQDGLANGPLDISKGGAISLLHPPPGHSSSSSSSSSVNNSSSSVNGDLDVVDFAKSKHEAVLIRSRSDSIDGSQPNIVRVSWASEKNSSTMTTTPSGKNIVISAINKSNNTVVTKVLGSNQGSKIISANNLSSVKNSSGSSSTSILSPRISGQQTVKVANLQGKSSSTSGTATSPKIITVSGPSSGSKSSSSSTGSSNNSSSTSGKSSSSSSSSSNNSSSAVLSLNSALQQCLDGSADVELGKLDEKLVQILAWQRLQQLLPNKQSNNSSSSSNKKGVLNGLLNLSGQPITMSYRTLSIGTGADMEVCLTQFGSCSYISPKHAQIFYDETTKHYELLNYSEHGTTVDNVLYSCDFSDKLSSKSVPTPIVAAVRKIIKKGKAKKEEKQEERITMSSSTEFKKVCNCKASSSSLIGGSGAGWEGTALLHHGSYIKVGCLQFVFSIVDHATGSMGQDRKKEPMSLLKSTLKASTP